MRPVVVNVETSRPAREVFDFVSDVENNPRWQRGMRSCVWTSPAPHGVGATYDQTAHFLGKDVVSQFVVTDHEPPHRFRITRTSGPFPITETRQVDDLGDGRTRVTATVEGDASRYFRWAAPALRMLVLRSVRRDYERLAQILTSPPRG